VLLSGVEAELNTRIAERTALAAAAAPVEDNMKGGRFQGTMEDILQD
jgi:hypothetical protein